MACDEVVKHQEKCRPVSILALRWFWHWIRKTDVDRVIPRMSTMIKLHLLLAFGVGLGVGNSLGTHTIKNRQI